MLFPSPFGVQSDRKSKVRENGNKLFYELQIPAVQHGAQGQERRQETSFLTDTVELI